MGENERLDVSIHEGSWAALYKIGSSQLKSKVNNAEKRTRVREDKG